MWSDPIDEAIAQLGRLLDDLPQSAISDLDRSILRRVHRDALAHRELENQTGKVGFAAAERS
jgi:hypothetical protein